nr:prepilin-type N-terminal cleavage/methylation domain-containing protein [Noviherbaspirillum humi]
MRSRTSPTCVRRKRCGFTLVELIFVTVIVSVLAAVTMVKVNANSAQRTLAAQADQLRRDLSQVQALAISAGVPLRLSVNASGNAYQVVCLAQSSGNLCSAVNATPINPTTGSSYQVTLDQALIAPANTTVDFDTAGRPGTYSASGSSYVWASMLTANPAKTLTITVSGQSLSVYVRPVSGLAERS